MARPVQVPKDRIEQARPLSKAGFQPRPVLGRYQIGHRVELDRPQPGFVACPAVADAILAEQAPRLLPASLELASTKLLESAKQTLPVRPHAQAGPLHGEELVMRAPVLPVIRTHQRTATAGSSFAHGRDPVRARPRRRSSVSG